MHIVGVRWARGGLFPDGGLTLGFAMPVPWRHATWVGGGCGVGGFIFSIHPVVGGGSGGTVREKNGDLIAGGGCFAIQSPLSKTLRGWAIGVEHRGQSGWHTLLESTDGYSGRVSHGRSDNCLPTSRQGLATGWRPPMVHAQSPTLNRRAPTPDIHHTCGSPSPPAIC